MNHFLNKFKLIIFCFLLIVVSETRADRKYFGYTYLSYTLPAREFELELWQTIRSGKNAGSFFRWQPQLELEYGITDRLTSSIYFNFIAQTSKQNEFTNIPLKFSTVSLELRYRLSSPEEYFIDPALYLEISYNSDKTEYEPKILLTKRIGRFISGVNIISAIEKQNSGEELETEFELSMGLAYEVTNNLALGIELRNQRIFSEFYGKQISQVYYAGPTINYSGNGFSFVLNFMAQLAGTPSATENLNLINHERYQARAIMSLDL